MAGPERVSEHPLAAAIVRGAEERGIQTGPVADFRSVTGKGVVGVVDGRTVAIGNTAMLAEVGATVAFTARADDLRRNGETVMFVAVDGAYAGLVGVADRVKATTVEAITALHDEGLRIVMLDRRQPGHSRGRRPLRRHRRRGGGGATRAESGRRLVAAWRLGRRILGTWRLCPSD